MKSNGELTRLIRTIAFCFKTCRMDLHLLMQLTFITSVKSFLSDANISFWKIHELVPVKLCCFVCPVGFVVNKSKEKRL